MKTTFIFKLHPLTQKKIQRQLTLAYHSLGLNKEQIKIELEIALSGRLSDLEDTIDISQYIS